ncbi:unnamed protein product [Penicillium discolor]
MSDEDEPRDEIELVSDGDGLAVIGDPLAVERFLSTAGVASRELNLAHAVGGALNVGSMAAKGGAEVAASAGRWVKLTEESARALKLGNAMKGSSDSVSRAIVTTSKGKITNILEFVKPGTTIAETQSYALHRLDSLAEKMEKESRVGDLAKIAKIAEADVEEWLAVLARCFQLQDGLAAGRAKRRDLIAKSTERLLARMDSAAVTANRKVLFHPLKPGEVVRSSNEVGADVLVFHEMLGISDTRVNLKKKHWAVAVVEARDATVEAGVTTAQTAGKLGARGAEAVALFSADAAHSAKDTVVKVSSAVMSKLRRGIDGIVLDEFGVYAIRLRSGAAIPEPFQSHLNDRATRVIYVGRAEKQTLLYRLLGNELRARGNGTFIRSIGAVLGYRPPFGSLAGRTRVQNYRFAPTDRIAIVDWIDANLDVSWSVLPQSKVHEVEVVLIREHTPLLNLQDNPRALPELSTLRAECRAIAAGLSNPVP